MGLNNQTNNQKNTQEAAKYHDLNLLSIYYGFYPLIRVKHIALPSNSI